MEQDNDASYYRRREMATRELADQSRDFAIRRIHEEMADRYAEKVRALDGSRS